MNDNRPEKKRRPAGVSRRRKKQLGFESLEDRRVMSANAPLAAPPALLQFETTSHSSATAEGQIAQLVNELYWQSLMANATTSAQRSIPTDPLLANQWHLINLAQNVGSPDWQPIYGVRGEDINVASLWNEGYTGNGVRIAVIDSGIQLEHPDLVGNLDLSDQFNSLTQAPDGGPTNIAVDPLAAHGTAVAGLIGAVANNGQGGVGVAYGATLVPINNGGALGASVVNALYHSINNNVDITNNSYGPPDTLRTLAGPTAQELLALRDSVIFGRDGKGIINVWAAGNGAGQYGTRPGFSGVGTFDASNFDGYANSRYTIAVTGVDHDGSYNNVDGSVTNYMEAGSNVLVAAPTGSVSLDIANDAIVGSGLWTTDTYVFLQGRDIAGLNQSPDEMTGAQTDLARDYFADTRYTSRFNGTSGSAPIVAGVVALMLEANPELTWRDVQEILVRSARQNDPVGIPQNGAGIQGINPWIVNQTPLFVDPDFTPAPTDVFTPSLDPNLTFNLNVALDGTIYSDRTNVQPYSMTNGAGYTVAQGHGIYGEMLGYGHGVVDAELAVRMAEQWHAKNQALAPELTFTTFVNAPGNAGFDIPSSARGNDDALNIIVPGGIGGDGDFIGWINEYFDDLDFSDLTYGRGVPSLQFSVPANNTMSIESVDVKLAITGDAAAAMDHLRIALVSPHNTISELNHFWYDQYAIPFSQQSIDPTLFYGDPGSVAPDGGFNWTFNTNRSWGERSDNAISFNPLTNEPYVDEIGLFGPLTDTTIGEALEQGWRLVIENWDAGAEFDLVGVELAWHGRPIAAESFRVQGIIGVDDNRDDLFNFTRMVEDTLGTTLASNPLLPINYVPDLTQESFGANVTVTARRASDNVIVSQFVTGHDGNYYFDLVPDDYIISIDDPLGRSAIDDTLTPDGLLDHYRSEWTITRDYFKVWDHDPLAINEVLTDANGDPLAWLDSTPLAQTVDYGMKGINFLLDPGAPVAQQVEFNGTIFADVNADGLYNGDDINMPSVIVFGDVNRNGLRDPGEISVQTDANGHYSLVVPVTQASVMSVGVVRPTNWTSTNDLPGTADPKTDGLETFFVQPGAVIDDVIFAIAPPANNIGGGNLPGFLLGVVYEDANNNQSRQAGERGAANMTVFIDANNSGVIDLGDTVTTTNEHGAFIFANVAPGQKVIRTVVNSPLVQTTPAPGTGRIVTLAGSSTISNIQFGVRNTATLDFGDLPAIYGATTLAQNGARHSKGAYWLGPTIDTELDGIPSVNADGDDLFAPFADEDGITFGTIVPGTTASLVATASRSNGVLQGWVDWNNDGDFNDVGERIITNKVLNAGPNAVTFSVPAGANVAQVYARFRYGEFGINSINGAAQLGEVEDYRLTVAIPAAPIPASIPGDADADGDVDGMDFLAWQRNLGRTNATAGQGDASGDGRVDSVDLNRIKYNFGASNAAAQAAVVAPSADFDSDGDVDGADFLTLQRGLGLGSPAHGAGDANRDGTVNLADAGIWRQTFGALTPGTAAAASYQFVASATASTTASASEARSFSFSGAPLAPATVAASIDAAVAEQDDFAAEFSRKPFGDLGRAFASTARTAERSLSRRAEFDEPVRAADTSAGDLGDFLRQDRAFADLFGSRRRQGLRAELVLERAEAEAECDEAFALLGDHVEVPQD